MTMLDEALFERVIHWAASELGEEYVRASRQRFEQATGAIEEGAPDFDSRMAHFFEGWLREEHEGESLLVRYAREVAPDRALVEQLAALQRSHRTLLEFEGFEAGVGHVRDLLLHGRYRFQPSERDRELSLGDRFDGRILAGAHTLWLSPGRVYHPRAAFTALDALLVQPAVRALRPVAVLDALLRMRSRFMRFESIRPEHVFCVDGLALTPFAAPWAGQAQRRGP